MAEWKKEEEKEVNVEKEYEFLEERKATVIQLGLGDQIAFVYAKSSEITQKKN